MCNSQSIPEAERCFERWLWANFPPNEVLEDFARDMTQKVVALSSVMDVDPDVIVATLPLSPVVLSYVEKADHDFRVPLEDRAPFDLCMEFYDGLSLRPENRVNIAVRIQSDILPDSSYVSPYE
jgi:hypothetical protein